MPGPVFARGDRVELRTVEPSDVDFVREHANDPAVRPWIGIHTPVDEDEVESWLESDDGVEFLACVDGDPVGYVWLMRLDRTRARADLGYWIAPAHQGEGYATDAVAELVAYAFDDLGLERVTAGVFEGNDASHRVVEKLGFEREGRLRKAEIANGSRVDVVLYGLLAEEWDPASD